MSVSAAVHGDAGLPAARQVAVPELQVLDEPRIALEVDGAGAVGLAEEVLHRRLLLLAVAEGDLHVVHLEIAVLDHDHQLLELAFLLADLDLIEVALALDRALAEQHPAGGVEVGLEDRARGRTAALFGLAVHGDASAPAA